MRLVMAISIKSEEGYWLFLQKDVYIDLKIVQRGWVTSPLFVKLRFCLVLSEKGHNMSYLNDEDWTFS